MTVFNAFLKVIKKNLGTIILYTVIVVFFAAINSRTDDSSTQFVGEKPDVMIVNLDKGTELSGNFEKYLTDNTNKTEISGGDEAVSDALFYREISCVITIPKGYEKTVLEGKTPEIEIKSAGTQNSAFVKNIVSSYIRTQNAFASSGENKAEIIKSVNSALSQKASVAITSKLNTGALTKLANYYIFSSYGLMSCILFIICIVLTSFSETTIRKRTIISSMSYKKFSANLLLSCFTYALAVWILFVVLAYFMMGSIVFTMRGAAFMLNSFIFILTALSLSFMLSTFVPEKNAITGIVNVLTLGSSFLCGVFVPAAILPSWVLSIAKVLPSYWYVDSCNKLAEVENLRSNFMPIVINMGILIGFGIVFAVLGIIVSGKKRKIE